jgi:hypothetical protein
LNPKRGTTERMNEMLRRRSLTPAVLFVTAMAAAVAPSFAQPEAEKPPIAECNPTDPDAAQCIETSRHNRADAPNPPAGSSTDYYKAADGELYRRDEHGNEVMYLTDGNTAPLGSGPRDPNAGDCTLDNSLWTNTMTGVQWICPDGTQARNWIPQGRLVTYEWFATGEIGKAGLATDSCLSATPGQGVWDCHRVDETAVGGTNLWTGGRLFLDEMRCLIDDSIGGWDVRDAIALKVQVRVDSDHDSRLDRIVDTGSAVATHERGARGPASILVELDHLVPWDWGLIQVRIATVTDRNGDITLSAQCTVLAYLLAPS